MRGKLIAASLSSDHPTSRSVHSPSSGTPSPTPRHNADPAVGHYYFLLFYEPTESQSARDVGEKAEPSSPSISAAPPSPLRAQLLCTPPRKAQSIQTEGVTVHLVAIDNISGRFHYNGIPFVDAFDSEQAALRSIAQKVTLSPDGIIVTEVCTFEGWGGAYASEDALHLLLIVDAERAANALLQRREAHEAPSQCHNNPRSSEIWRATQVMWKSLPIQCPDSALNNHVPHSHNYHTAAYSDGHALGHLTESLFHRKQKQANDEPNSSSQSNFGGECHLDHHPQDYASLNGLLRSATDLPQPTAATTRKSLLPTAAGRALHFSHTFDISNAVSTTTALQASQWSTFIGPSAVVVTSKPSSNLLLCEHLWNVELIRFCESMSGVGEFCVRLMYGTVQQTRYSNDDFAEKSLGSTRSSAASASSNVGGGEGTVECEMLLVVSRLSRASLRQTLVEPLDTQYHPMILGDLTEERRSVEIHAPLETELQVIVQRPSLGVSSFIYRRGVGSLFHDPAVVGVQSPLQESSATSGRRKSILEKEAHSPLTLLLVAIEQRHRETIVESKVPQPEKYIASSRHSVNSPNSSIPVHSSGGSGVRTTERDWDQAIHDLENHKRFSARSFPEDGVAAVPSAVPSTSLSNETMAVSSSGSGHRVIRRCCIADDKQLSSSLLVCFYWVVNDIRGLLPCWRETISQELRERASTPKEGTLLRDIWQLLYGESVSQLVAPGSCSHDSYVTACDFLRSTLAASSTSVACTGSAVPWDVVHSYAPLIRCVADHLAVGTSAVLDHSQSAFLQGLVQNPAHFYHISKTRSFLLSDVNGGATLISATVSVDASNGKGLVRSAVGDVPNSDPRLDGECTVIPLPTIPVLRCALMPKSPPPLCPEGVVKVSMTVALPQLSWVSHVALTIPSSAQEAMFTSALCFSMTSSEYLVRECERIVFQDVPLPLSVGSLPALGPSLVVFPLPKPTAAPHVITLMNGVSPFANAAPVVGRYFTFHFRGSGRIPMMIPTVLLFGKEVQHLPHSARAKFLMTKEEHLGGGGVSLSSQEEVQRGFQVCYQSLNSVRSSTSMSQSHQMMMNFDPSASLWTSPMTSSSPHAGLPTGAGTSWTLITGEKFTLNGEQRGVLLHGRMVETADFCGQSSSPVVMADSTRSSPVAPISPLALTSTADFGQSPEPRVGDRSPSPQVAHVDPLATKFVGSLGAPPPLPDVTRDRLTVNAPDSLSAEDIYLTEVVKRVPIEKLHLMGVTDALSIELIRIRLQLTSAMRDRILAKGGYPIWMFDPTVHVTPQSVTLTHANPKKSNRCFKCASKLTFLTKKKECYRCKETFCVKCSAEYHVKLVELGVKAISPQVLCAQCAAMVAKVESLLQDVAKAQNGVVVHSNQQEMTTLKTFLAPRSASVGQGGGTPTLAPTAAPMIHAPSIAPNSFAADVVVVPHQNATVVPRNSIFGSSMHCVVHPTACYNLCVGNSASVVAQPRVQSLKDPINTSTRYLDYFERVVGNACLPGRGWRCVAADEVNNTQQTVTRSVTILLAAPAEVDRLVVEGVRHGGHLQASSAQEVVLTVDEAENIEMFSSQCETERFIVPWSSATLVDAQRNVSRLECTLRRNGDKVNTDPCTPPGKGDPPTGAKAERRFPRRLYLIRFSGTARSLHDLEITHLSLWGRYVSAPRVELSKLSFLSNGGLHSADHRYSVRKAGEGLTRHMSIVSSGGPQLRSPPLLPRPLPLTRLITAKSHFPVQSCSNSFTVEYDFGTPMTVCGVIIENHHSPVCAFVATALRFHGVSTDGQRCNIATVRAPLALVPDANERTECLSLSFAFPTSNRELLAVQVEATEWVMNPYYHLNCAPGTPSPGTAERTSNSANGSSNTTHPHMGKLTFWTSPNPNTRRIVASGVFISAFSSQVTGAGGGGGVF